MSHIQGQRRLRRWRPETMIASRHVPLQLRPRWVYITYRFFPCNIRAAYANEAIKVIMITSREILFSGLTAELRFADVLETTAEDEQQPAMKRQLKLCLIDNKFYRLPGDGSMRIELSSAVDSEVGFL